MGSYAVLRIGTLWVAELKSDVPSEMASIFRDSDLVISPSGETHWDALLERSVPASLHIFSLSVSDAISRLNVMGFTASLAHAAFEAGIRDRLEELQAWYDDEGHEDEHSLRQLTLSDYLGYLKDVLSSPYSLFEPELGPHLSGTSAFLHEELREDFFWSFPSGDPRWAIRLILELSDPADVLALDVSELVDNEYIQDVSRYCQDKRAAVASDAGQVGPIIVLTEGSSDSMILRDSLALMHPELIGYFSFLDFSFLNLQGGAPELVRAIKSFATAGVANRVIAIFDNDSAAHDALSLLDQKKLPGTIRVLHYPTSSIASSYPTVGPAGGIELMDVNGKAASLELYFGSSVLMDSNGALMPVRWTGYVQKLKRYQGEVEGKATLQKEFVDLLASLRGQPASVVRTKLPDMALVLDTLRNAFN